MTKFWLNWVIISYFHLKSLYHLFDPTSASWCDLCPRDGLSLKGNFSTKMILINSGNNRFRAMFMANGKCEIHIVFLVELVHRLQ